MVLEGVVLEVTLALATLSYSLTLAPSPPANTVADLVVVFSGNTHFSSVVEASKTVHVRSSTLTALFAMTGSNPSPEMVRIEPPAL